MSRYIRYLDLRYLEFENRSAEFETTLNWIMDNEGELIVVATAS
jgi:hypothetical protein